MAGRHRCRFVGFRVVFRSSKHEHVSPLLHALHWLPICRRINCKLSSISSFFSLTCSGLADILKIYVPSRQLRSSSDLTLVRLKSLLSIQSYVANAVLHTKVLQSGTNSRTAPSMLLSLTVSEPLHRLKLSVTEWTKYVLKK